MTRLSSMHGGTTRAAGRPRSDEAKSAARARRELNRERQRDSGVWRTNLVTLACRRCSASANGRPASSPVSPFALFLPPTLTPTTTAPDAPRHRNTHLHRTCPDCLLPPGPTAPGQHLAASIGSTDPPIARLPNWGLATRDKAEGAPPSGPQTAHGTHLHNTQSLQQPRAVATIQLD